MLRYVFGGFNGIIERAIKPLTLDLALLWCLALRATEGINQIERFLNKLNCDTKKQKFGLIEYSDYFLTKK